MKANSHRRGSRMACIKPARALLEGSSPAVSRAIRSCASCRSAGVSQRVVSGWSGSRNMAAMATPKVTAPSILLG